MATVLNSATAKAAERIANRAVPHGSIMLILALVGFVMQLITFIQAQCAEKKERRLKLFRNPAPAHRAMVRRQARKICTGEYAQYADAVADSVLAEASGASDAQCLAVISES